MVEGDVVEGERDDEAYPHAHAEEPGFGEVTDHISHKEASDDGDYDYIDK